MRRRFQRVLAVEAFVVDGRHETRSKGVDRFSAQTIADINLPLPVQPNCCFAVADSVAHRRTSPLPCNTLTNSEFIYRRHSRPARRSPSHSDNSAHIGASVTRLFIGPSMILKQDVLDAFAPLTLSQMLTWPLPPRPINVRHFFIRIEIMSIPKPFSASSRFADANINPTTEYEAHFFSQRRPRRSVLHGISVKDILTIQQESYPILRF